MIQTVAKEVWTEAELQALPDDSYNCELVDGESVMSRRFASGTQIAWVIDTEHQCAEICHSLTDRRLVPSGGFLEGEHLLPGFRYPITDLFQE